MGLQVALERGCTPKISLGSTWALACMCVSGRTLQRSRLQCICRTMNILWQKLGQCSQLSLDSTGLVSFQGQGSFHHPVHDGCVDVDAVLTDTIQDPSVRLTVGKSLNSVGGSLKQVALPTLALVIRRYCSVARQSHDQLMNFAKSLTHACIQAMEAEHLTAVFSQELPDGAVNQYFYKCGQSCQRPDPRASAPKLQTVSIPSGSMRRSYVYKRTLYV